MSRTSWPVPTCSHDTSPDRAACIAESSLQWSREWEEEGHGNYIIQQLKTWKLEQSI